MTAGSGTRHGDKPRATAGAGTRRLSHTILTRRKRGGRAREREREVGGGSLVRSIFQSYVDGSTICITAAKGPW